MDNEAIVFSQVVERPFSSDSLVSFVINPRKSPWRLGLTKPHHSFDWTVSHRTAAQVDAIDFTTIKHGQQSTGALVLFLPRKTQMPKHNTTAVAVSFFPSDAAGPGSGQPSLASFPE